MELVERIELRKSQSARRSDPDLPPESITIPISGDSGWAELSPVYDRDDSTKGSTNPKSHASNSFPWSKSRSGSTRVAATNLNPTAATPIIGLPAKIKRPGFIQCRRPPPIFPKWRSGSGSKKSGLPPESEPGSPKVSCIGKVLSEREREKRRRKKEERKRRECERERNRNTAGCWNWNGFDLILHCAGGRKKLEAVEVRRLPEKVEEVRRSDEMEELRRSPEKEAEAVVEPPAIGAMKKFSSGRRAAAWGDDVVCGAE